MASKAKLEPKKKHTPKKDPAKATHNPEKEKEKGTPKKNPLRLTKASKNWWPVRGKWKGTNLRSQEGLATPGARLQPILKRKKKDKKKKKKDEAQWGGWPLAKGMASKAVSYRKRTSGVPKSPSNLVTTHDKRNLRLVLFETFRVSRSRFSGVLTSADIANSSMIEDFSNQILSVLWKLHVITFPNPSTLKGI